MSPGDHSTGFVLTRSSPDSPPELGPREAEELVATLEVFRSCAGVDTVSLDVRKGSPEGTAILTKAGVATRARVPQD